MHWIIEIGNWKRQEYTLGNDGNDCQWQQNQPPSSEKSWISFFSDDPLRTIYKSDVRVIFVTQAGYDISVAVHERRKTERTNPITSSSAAAYGTLSISDSSCCETAPKPDLS